MKVFAQSQVPSVASYVHLGYLAAAADHARKAGTSFILLGAVMTLGAVAAALHTWRRKARDATGRRLRYYTGLFICAALFLLGIAALASGAVAWRSAADVATKYQVSTLSYRLESALRQSNERPEPSPSSVREFLRPWRLLDEEDLRDTWSRRIQFDRRTSDQGHQYVVRSAGRDGEYGTADDIVRMTAWIPRPLPESADPVAPETAAAPARDSAAAPDD